MIDAPTLVVVHRARPEKVEEGVLHPFGVKVPENIGETPRYSFLESISNRLVKANMLQVFLGAVNVDRLRSDIHVPAPDRGTVR